MGLKAFARLEGMIAGIGRSVAWLSLGMVILTFAVVLLRYGFSLGWIWLQESVIYLHAAVFLLAAAWTLQDDAHVRVDIFYRSASPRSKAWVDLVGSVLFIAPFCVFVIVMSWDYVMASWRLLEGSREAGGVPLVYLLKSLLLLFPALLGLQSLRLAQASLARIRGAGADPV